MARSLWRELLERRLAASLLSAMLIAAPVPASAQETLGWIEDAILHPNGLKVRAKLDTGARTSSLHAPKVRIVQRDGARWAAFEVTNRWGEAVKFERRIVRTVKIKSLTGESQERPVVRLGICVGSIYQVTQVNLVDRGGFNYQLLIGRTFMQERIAVDPGLTFVAKPDCTVEAEP